VQSEQRESKTGPVAEVKPETVATSKTSGRKSRRTEPAAARPGTKKATVLKLLGRAKGATLKEMMKATGWQAHSVRGFLSGAVGKKMGLKLKTLDRDGERAYQIKG
jgi:hypothetical protein